MADKSDEMNDTKRTSRATRRIVVEDLPAEPQPPVQGRRLLTPKDVSAPDESVLFNDRVANYSQRTPARGLGEVRSRDSHSQRSSGVAAGVRTKGKPSGGADQVNVKRMLMLIGGMVGVVGLASVVLVLWLGGSKPKTAAPVSQQTTAVASPVPAQSTPAVVTPSPVATESAATQPAPDSQPGTVAPLEAQEVRTLSQQLAAQISQKGGYAFAPEFVELIREKTQEYSSQKALAAARVFRREINKSFRDEGMSPLIGYTLALSRSKFDPSVTEKGIGIWQIPTQVVRLQGYLGPSENAAKLKIPETSAQISAAYTKALLSTFDAEDFMYAIACYGMSLQDAGRVQARLISVAPEARNRRDIMTIIRAGVLNSNQVDSVARFFAAGIVGENPQKFGLEGVQPFSSLY